VAAADADMQALLSHPIDLLLVGGPTVSRGMTPPLGRCVEALVPSARTLTIGTFDTRYRGSELIMGSAAKKAADRLTKAGARVVARESFYVVRAEAPRGQRTAPGLAALGEGEESRAEEWGRQLAESAAARIAASA
jgi:hypothetical protein